MTTKPTTTSPRNRTLNIVGICAAGALLVAGGGYAITGAAFTDQEVITGNSVGAATLTIGDTVSAPVNVTDLLPGQNTTEEDVIAFTNTGSVPFDYTVTLTNIAASTGAPTELLGWIPVTISNGTTSETGTLAAPPTLTGGTAAVDAAAAIDVTVGLATAATNAAQGDAATFDVVVTATQVAPN